jgi:type II secretory pathway component PulF
MAKIIIVVLGVIVGFTAIACHFLPIFSLGDEVSGS